MQIGIDSFAAAYDDAKLQFDAFNTRCRFQDPELTRIEPPEYAVTARKDGVPVAASDQTGATPIIPESASRFPRLRGATALVAAPFYAAPQVA